MTVTPTTRLKAQNITVGYGESEILSSVDFEVLEGELSVILGPNACGKSTLLKTLSRVLHPKSGQVQLDDIPLKDQKSKEIARILAMLPQTPEAPSDVTVFDVVARGRYPHQSLLRSWSEDDEAACLQAIRAANIEEIAERPLQALSGGQRQRVWIAMTLAQQTPLLLLDEPTTYLDITHQIEVLSLTRELHRAGKTVVVVLHDLNLAFRYATHVVMMKQGKIITQGRPQEIISADLIKEIYDLDCTVITDPNSNTPLVIPSWKES